MKLVIGGALVLVFGGLALAFLLLLDRRADRVEWDRLSALQPEDPIHFDPLMVADLPEPARRYFAYAPWQRQGRARRRGGGGRSVG